MPWLVYMLLAANATVQQVPEGTRLHVRLTSAVGSYASRPGAPVSAVLIASVTSNGGTLLPAGSTLSGQVKSVRRVGFGIVHETAAIELSFDQLKLPGGHT